MPISKNGKKYYTKEQYEFARYDCSALEYAKSQGYELIQRGRHWEMKEHDSFVFAENGMWFWNSRNLHGGAIEFLTIYEHHNYIDAILILNGEQEHQLRHEAVHSYAPKKTEEIKRDFVLPKANENAKRVFSYLINERGIDFNIIKSAMQQRILYEDANKHNAIFVSRDDNGNAVGAFMRGTLSFADKAFKMDVPGSQKAPFVFKGLKGVTTLKIFESAIDALSEATICKLDDIPYKDCDRIALGGLNLNVFEQWWKTHKHLYSAVEICFDNDINGTTTIRENGIEKVVPCNHGQVAAQKLLEKLEEEYRYVFIQTPINKDFNEDLKAKLSSIREQISCEEIEEENTSEPTEPEPEFDEELDEDLEL